VPTRPVWALVALVLGLGGWLMLAGPRERL